MKQYVIIIAILGIGLSCSSSSKSFQKKELPLSTSKEKPINFEKQIAPGTCAISIVNCHLLSENGKYWVLAKINSVQAYGAGFTSIFVKDQALKIQITKQQAIALKNRTSFYCLISSIEGLGSKPVFKLLSIQNK